MGRRILTAREQHEMLSPWRRLAAPRKKFREPMHVSVPIDVLKQYSTFNPYEPEDDETAEQSAERMAPYEETLSNEGWDGFGKLDQPPSYPALSVGRSGQHAVLNGHHRLWAADKLGLTHIPVDIYHDDDDDWAQEYGRPVEPHIHGLLGGA
jgi:hypothetical protein